MARISRAAAVVLTAIGSLLIGPTSSAAAEPPGCSRLAVLDCPLDSGAISGGTTIHGWLLVPDRGETVRASAHEGGCADCVWTISTLCIRNTGQSGPDGDHCDGSFVGCAPGEQRYRVFLATSETPSTLVSQYCRADTSGAVSEATVLPDIRQYLDQIAVGQPAISTWPHGRSLVNLATYFAAPPASSGSRTFGGTGYTMTLMVNPASYDWSFGDGSTLSSDQPGSGPPDGPIHHVYQTAGDKTVELSVAYGATYTVVTPAGSIGPLDVPGPQVRSLPTTVELEVDEALGTLIR